MMIRQHEVIDDRCRHCGALKPGDESTCIMRMVTPEEEVRPEPARRAYAIEDYDFIADRLAELDTEREAAHNSPPAEWRGDPDHA